MNHDPKSGRNRRAAVSRARKAAQRVLEDMWLVQVRACKDMMATNVAIPERALGLVLSTAASLGKSVRNMASEGRRAGKGSVGFSLGRHVHPDLSDRVMGQATKKLFQKPWSALSSKQKAQRKKLTSELISGDPVHHFKDGEGAPGIGNWDDMRYQVFLVSGNRHWRSMTLEERRMSFAAMIGMMALRRRTEHENRPGIRSQSAAMICGEIMSWSNRQIREIALGAGKEAEPALQAIRMMEKTWLRDTDTPRGRRRLLGKGDAQIIRDVVNRVGEGKREHAVYQEAKRNKIEKTQNGYGMRM